MTESGPSPRPERHLWLTLGMGLLFAAYMAVFALGISGRSICAPPYGQDFCSFWSAGYVANQHGYAAVYDLSEMEKVERAIYPSTASAAAFEVDPTPFFPIFILPLRLLAIFPPVPTYWAWTILNLILFLAYTRFLAKRTSGRPAGVRLILLLLLAWPVFVNALTGQINIVLLVCVGEFMRAMLEGSQARAGIWLAGLLLKPQFLVLLVPILLFKKAYKALGAFALGSAILLGLSLLLLGPSGIQQMALLWGRYVSGNQESLAPQLMLNWRMVGLYLEQFLSQSVANTLALAGLLLTAGATLYIWRGSGALRRPAFPTLMLGTLAGTLLVTWHSHVAVAVILIVPFLLLALEGGSGVQRLLLWWVFLTPTAFFLDFVLTSFYPPLLAPIVDGLLKFLPPGRVPALTQFGLTLSILAWAIARGRELRGAAGAEPIEAQFPASGQ